jgi:hypothetical protein
MIAQWPVPAVSSLWDDTVAYGRRSIAALTCVNWLMSAPPQTHRGDGVAPNPDLLSPRPGAERFDAKTSYAPEFCIGR